jgi:hypothetical protein
MAPLQASPVSWRRIALRGGALFLILLLGVFALTSQTRLVHRWVRDRLADRLAAHGFELGIRGFSGGLVDPLQLEGIRITTPGGLRLSARRADLTLNWFRILTRKSGGWVTSLHCEDLRVRGPETPPEAPRPWPAWDPRPWLPAQFHLNNIDARIAVPNGGYLALRDASVWADAGGPGAFHAGEIRAGYGKRSWSSRTVAGTTAWKDGVIYLAGAELPGAIALDDLSVDVGALRRQRLELLFNARWQEGALRGDVAVSGRGTAWHVDGTLSSWNIDLSRLPALGSGKTRATGHLQEGRISFRGTTSALLHADWGVRVVVDDFALGSRRFDALALGATASQGSLQLYELALRQGSNALSARGEAELPANIGAWSGLRGSGWIDARLDDIRAFAALLPRRFHHLEGRGVVRGAIVASKDRFEGTIETSAAPLGIRGVQLDGAEASLALDGDTLDIRKAAIRRGGDHLSATGTVGLDGAHRYRGEFQLVAAEVGDYERLFPIRGFDGLRGALDLTWSGDGTARSHSGAFSARAARIQIPLRPDAPPSLPLDGHIEATYSPESLFSRTFELRQNQTALAATLIASPTSLALQSLTIHRANKPLLSGNLWLPLDIRGLWRGQGLTRIIDPDGKLYADLSGAGIDLAELLRLTGREWPVRGKCALRVEASGTPSQLSAKGSLQAAALQFSGDSPAMPPTDLAVDFNADEALVQFTGNLSNPATRDTRISGSLPTRIREALQTGSSFLRTDAPLDLQLRLGDANLAHWAPLLGLPWIESGSARGNLRISGSGDAPIWSGQLQFSGGRVATPPGFDPLTRMTGNLVLTDTVAELRDARATSGATTVRLGGSIAVANPVHPRLNLRIDGEKVRIAPPGLAVSTLARVAIAIDGPAETARVSGTIVATDGEAHTKIRLLRLDPPELPPRALLPPLILAPLPGGWELDVELAAPALKGAGASAAAALMLRGTVASPYVLGWAALAGWPFTFAAGDGTKPLAGTLSEVRWEFEAANPWMPRFTTSGIARAADGSLTQVRFVADGCHTGTLERSDAESEKTDAAQNTADPLSAAGATPIPGGGEAVTIRESALVQFGD